MHIISPTQIYQEVLGLCLHLASWSPGIMSLVKIDSKTGGFAAPADNIISRLCADVAGPFRLQPSFASTDGPKRKIDISASFSPKGFLPLVFKIIVLQACLVSIYVGFVKNPRLFWLAYLSSWNIVISTLYSFSSLMNMAIPVSQPRPGHSIVCSRTKISWILFEVSANVGILISAAFWTVLFESPLSAFDVLEHGGVTLLVLLDGLVVNTIPVRVRHYAEVVFPFMFMYLLWSYLHKAFDIGNPDTADEDTATNDDLIYTQLDWKEEPLKTGIVGVLLVFVVSPVIQFCLWALSSCRRRYVPLTGVNKYTMDNYVEGESEIETPFQAI